MESIDDVSYSRYVTDPGHRVLPPVPFGPPADDSVCFMWAFSSTSEGVCLSSALVGDSPKQHQIDANSTRPGL